MKKNYYKIYNYIPGYYGYPIIDRSKWDRIRHDDELILSIGSVKVDDEPYELDTITLSANFSEITKEVKRLQRKNKKVVYVEVDGVMDLRHKEIGERKDLDVLVLLEFRDGEFSGYTITSDDGDLDY